MLTVFHVKQFHRTLMNYSKYQNQKSLGLIFSDRMIFFVNFTIIDAPIYIVYSCSTRISFVVIDARTMYNIMCYKMVGSIYKPSMNCHRRKTYSHWTQSIKMKVQKGINTVNPFVA